jgi:MFS superfamily sulfate permease-like transporter
LFVPSRIALKCERTTPRVVTATHIHSLALFTHSAHTPIPPSFSYTVKIYHLDGNLFFGSLRTLQRLMTPDADPDVVVLHLSNVKTFDMSAAQGLGDITQRCVEMGSWGVGKGVCGRAWCKGLVSLSHGCVLCTVAI